MLLKYNSKPITEGQFELNWRCDKFISIKVIRGIVGGFEVNILKKYCTVLNKSYINRFLKTQSVFIVYSLFFQPLLVG